MATTLLHLRSTTPGAVPTAEQLAVGELAVNLVDKKWYTKKTDGTIVCLNHLLVLDGGEIGDSNSGPGGGSSGGDDSSRLSNWVIASREFSYSWSH